MFKKKTIENCDVEGKKVLLRVDFNVPIKQGVVADDTRIKAALPTIKYLLRKDAAVILISHLGRPGGAVDPAFSLRPVAKRLQELSEHPVSFVKSCLGPEAAKASNNLKSGDLLLLENTRFHPGEKKNDQEMAEELASYADLFVNDAFGTAHRAHASNVGVASFLPSCAGYLLEKEIEYLGAAIADPERPFIAVLGGAKVSGKIQVINNLLLKADFILIGGGMANTFFKAKGYQLADSLVEDEAIETAKKLLDAGGKKLVIPIDTVIADDFSAQANKKIMEVGNIPDGWRIMDIGPRTISKFETYIAQGKTIVWNGPMGVFEFDKFADGTFQLAKIIADSNAISIVGGGDSAAAIEQSGLAEQITHVSTGGGASLQMLAGEQLPGLEALDNM